MSFDLAVWEDVEPFVGFVEALLGRWPDLDDGGGEDSPWASSPLLGEAFGPCGYFPMTWSRGPRVAGDIAAFARRHGLVCYDPQSERLLT